MKHLAFAIFLSACAFTGPGISQTSGSQRLITLSNPTENHVLVRVNCPSSNLSSTDDFHDFLVHPRAEVTAPVQMESANPCFIAGFVYVGSNEACAAATP